MSCKVHKRYKGIYKPRILCEGCWGLYLRTRYQKRWKADTKLINELLRNKGV